MFTNSFSERKGKEGQFGSRKPRQDRLRDEAAVWEGPKERKGRKEQLRRLQRRSAKEQVVGQRKQEPERKSRWSRQK